MKNLLLALMLAFGALGFGQQAVTVSILVTNTNGTPVSNQVVVGIYQGALGPVTVAGLTNANGIYMDSAFVSPQSSMLFYTSGGGCADSAFFFPTPNSFFYSDTLSICGIGGGNCNYTVSALPVAGFPNRALFNSIGGNINASWLWDFGDGNTSNQIAPFHTYAQAGTYYYCLTQDSCAPVCDSITVFNQGGGCDPFFFPIVSGNTVDILPSLLTGQFEAIVDWGDGQLDTFTPQNIPVLPAYISHTYSVPGSYTICFTHSNASLNCSNTRCDSVAVGSANPGCQALWVVDSINSINFAGSIVLWNLSSGTGASQLNYIWDWGDGTTSTGPYPMHTYSDTGVYAICLTVNDPVSGCTDTFCDSVGFDSSGNLIYKGSTFTGFSIMVMDPATIGSPELDLAADFQAYPNPSRGEIQITGPELPVTQLEVFSISGARIMSVSPDEFNINASVNIYLDEPGIYLLKISTPVGLVTKKILVQ